MLLCFYFVKLYYYGYKSKSAKAQETDRTLKLSCRNIPTRRLRFCSRYIYTVTQKLYI